MMIDHATQLFYKHPVKPDFQNTRERKKKTLLKPLLTPLNEAELNPLKAIKIIPELRPVLKSLASS